MSVFSSTWRCSLAAVAVGTLLGGAAPASAQDQPAGRSARASAPSSSEQDQLRQQLQSIRQRVEQLTKEGEGERAEVDRLKQEAQAIMARLSSRGPEAGPGQRRREPGPAGPGRGNPEQEKVRQQLQSLRQKIEQLEREGKHDEAESVKREAKAIYSRLAPRGPEAGPGQRCREAGPGDRTREAGLPGGRPLPPEDMAARIQHLRIAADNLKAAGLGREADGILQMAERMQSAATGGARPGRDGRPGPTPGMAPGPRGPANLVNPREVEELRGAVGEIARQMQQLREEMHRLAERNEKR